MGHGTAPLLEMRSIVKIYGGTKALNGASLSIYPGEIHALMGGNGAGKSTIIGIIGGSKMPNDGQIILGGKEIHFKSPKDAMEKGIAVVYQELSLVPHLTVSENISLCNPEVNKNGFYDWAMSDRIAQKALLTLGEAADNIHLRDEVSTLRADQMQMIEIARAVSMGAKIILFDEPTSSLNFGETQSLFKIIRKLSDQGLGIIFVSHRMNEIRELCDRITIFRDGQTVTEGALMSEKSDADIIRDMIGRTLVMEEAVSIDDYKEIDKNKELLHIEWDSSDLSCALKEGEIVGLAGLAGSGRSSLLRAVWGAQKNPHICLKLRGEEYAPKTPQAALNENIAYIGEDRAESGLFPTLPIPETLLMPHRVFSKQKLIRSKKENSYLNDIVQALKIKVPAIMEAPNSLSGGNQQKLLFGRWFIHKPTIFLLDEPTRGVDVHTKQDIYQLIKTAAKESHAGVIVVSSELAELVTLCHKVLILKDGRPERILYGDDINEDYMMQCITSSSEVPNKKEAD
jgi:ABC-type sugar transport system ATPase subunit